jgi:hypothetical protein
VSNSIIELDRPASELLDDPNLNRLFLGATRRPGKTQVRAPWPEQVVP